MKTFANPQTCLIKSKSLYRFVDKKFLLYFTNCAAYRGLSCRSRQQRCCCVVWWGTHVVLGDHCTLFVCQSVCLSFCPSLLSVSNVCFCFPPSFRYFSVVPFHFWKRSKKKITREYCVKSRDGQSEAWARTRPDFFFLSRGSCCYNYFEKLIIMILKYLSFDQKNWARFEPYPNLGNCITRHIPISGNPGRWTLIQRGQSPQWVSVTQHWKRFPAKNLLMQMLKFRFCWEKKHFKEMTIVVPWLELIDHWCEVTVIWLTMSNEV